MKFEVSDWVQAKTRNGEFVHGFIESLDEAQQLAQLFVVRSDNEQSVGQPATALVHWLRKLPPISLEEPEAIRSLIDIALATRDEQWFAELSERLSSVETPGKSANPIQELSNPTYSNRLRHKV
ncbi:IDEAL domain-containing protein [Cohnella endophytica]|uniref:IDEAL domain-containing protein n=1 Tax=Cohnella endophytica TaxID=2419778 RepID=A0A494XTE5_9BACL|nr:IDEAL domain-containing protein [Cohnella endophytica]RKP53923.1 IDEAL domain-containing protein [Cohnella endophytica]